MISEFPFLLIAVGVLANSSSSGIKSFYKLVSG
jgi:hypothetical protein